MTSDTASGAAFSSRTSSCLRLDPVALCDVWSNVAFSWPSTQPTLSTSTASTPSFLHSARDASSICRNSLALYLMLLVQGSPEVAHVSHRYASSEKNGTDWGNRTDRRSEAEAGPMPRSEVRIERASMIPSVTVSDFAESELTAA